MKIYVAAAFPEYLRARCVMVALRAQGHEITEDWTVGAEKAIPEAALDKYARNRIAVSCVLGVQRCDVFVLLVPRRVDIGRGCWAELGHADAYRKHIVVVGDDGRSVFTSGGYHVATDDDVAAMVVGFGP